MICPIHGIEIEIDSVCEQCLAENPAPTREEQAADAGFDTWDDYNGVK